MTQVSPQGTAASQWDLAGRRTQLTYPGAGLFVNYDYLVTGETTAIRENGAASSRRALRLLPRLFCVVRTPRHPLPTKRPVSAATRTGFAVETGEASVA